MGIRPPGFPENPPQLTLQSLLQRPSPPVPFPALRPPPQLAHRPPTARPPALITGGAPVLRDPRTGMQLRFQPPKNWAAGGGGGGGGGGYTRHSRPRSIRPAAAAVSSSLFASANRHHDFLRSQMAAAGRYMPGPASRVQTHFVHDASGNHRYVELCTVIARTTNSFFCPLT